MSNQNREEIIKQLQKKVEINRQIVGSLREFFGTYQSDFLKMYRKTDEERDEKLNEILAHQDRIFAKFHELMKQEE